MPYAEKEKRIAYNKEWRRKNPEYQKEWAIQNKEKSRSYAKKWREKNKKHTALKTKEWHKNHPWVVAYNGAKNRCLNPKVHNFHRYGGRGIKLQITKHEVKNLWIRDKAWGMECPTLDRIDNDGNYAFENCRFIEMRENIAKSNKERNQ